MSDKYFVKVGTKAVIRSKEIFNHEGSKPELLSDYYKKNGSRPIESNLLIIDSMFQEWCDLLFNQFNVAIQGKQSSFRLLETFKERYLDSGKIPDFHAVSSNDKSSMLDITTVRMHGLCPISLEQFSHSLFDIKRTGGRVTDDDIKTFLNQLRSKKCHYVFFIHSFDSFYKESKAICEIMFQLYKKEPNYIHIILSTSHLFAGKILNKLKYRLNLISFRNEYCESFFYERIQSTAIEGLDDEKDEATSQLNRLFGGEISFQSLKDVYEALPVKCREVLVYIMQRHLQKIDLDEKVRMAKPEKRAKRNTRAASMTKTVKPELVKDGEAAELGYNELLEYCQSKFILTKGIVLEGYLNELRDHRIIELDNSGKKIHCLPSKSLCENFLKFTEL